MGHKDGAVTIWKEVLKDQWKLTAVLKYPKSSLVELSLQSDGSIRTTYTDVTGSVWVEREGAWGVSQAFNLNLDEAWPILALQFLRSKFNSTRDLSLYVKERQSDGLESLLALTGNGRTRVLKSDSTSFLTEVSVFLKKPLHEMVHMYQKVDEQLGLFITSDGYTAFFQENVDGRFDIIEAKSSLLVKKDSAQSSYSEENLLAKVLDSGERSKLKAVFDEARRAYEGWKKMPLYERRKKSLWLDEYLKKDQGFKNAYQVYVDYDSPGKVFKRKPLAEEVIIRALMAGQSEPRFADLLKSSVRSGMAQGYQSEAAARTAVSHSPEETEALSHVFNAARLVYETLRKEAGRTGEVFFDQKNLIRNGKFDNSYRDYLFEVNNWKRIHSGWRSRFKKVLTPSSIVKTLVNESQDEIVRRTKAMLYGQGVSADRAQIKGGIDFNASQLDMQIRRDGNGMPLPVAQQDLDSIRISGLIPEILSIQPAASMPLFSEIR